MGLWEEVSVGTISALMRKGNIASVLGMSLWEEFPIGTISACVGGVPLRPHFSLDVCKKKKKKKNPIGSVLGMGLWKKFSIDAISA